MGFALPLLSRDRPFGNAREGREERPSPTVEIWSGRIPTVVMGVASLSFQGARHFGVMHFGKIGGATITDGRNIREGVPTICTT